MSIIRLKELKEMDTVKLNEKIVELKKELMKSKTQISSKQNPDKPGKIREIKRTIARIKTIINSRGGV